MPKMRRMSELGVMMNLRIEKTVADKIDRLRMALQPKWSRKKIAEYLIAKGMEQLEREGTMSIPVPVGSLLEGGSTAMPPPGHGTSDRGLTEKGRGVDSTPRRKRKPAKN